MAAPSGALPSRRSNSSASSRGALDPGLAWHTPGPGQVSGPPQEPSAAEAWPAAPREPPAAAGRSHSEQPGAAAATAKAAPQEEQQLQADDKGARISVSFLADLPHMRFAAKTLAHNLRTPVSLILQMTDSMQETPNADLERCSGIIKVFGQQLLCMIDAVRDNLTLMTGHLDLLPVRIPLLPSIAFAKDLLAVLMRPGVKIAVDVAPSVHACMDATRLQQVVQVLFRNAVKYTWTGTIWVRAAESGSRTVLVTENVMNASAVADVVRLNESLNVKHPELGAEYQGCVSVGLRFVSRLLRCVGGGVAISAEQQADGRTAVCRVTATLPRGPEDHVAAMPITVSASPEAAGGGQRGPWAQVAGAPSRSSRSTRRTTSASSQQPGTDTRSSLAAKSGVASTPSFEEEECVDGLQTALQSAEAIVARAQLAAAQLASPENRTSELIGAMREVQLQDRADRGADEPDVEPPLCPDSSSHAFAPARHERRVLVVEDEAAHAEALERLLLGDGYCVSVAVSGIDALEKFWLCRPPPDCVLLDMSLPDIPGAEVFSKMQQLSPETPVPVIIVSNHIEASDIIKGLRMGAVDYITKPYRNEEVLARLNSILTFHGAELRARQESAQQVQQLMRLAFPRHIVKVLERGHQVVLESLDHVVVLRFFISGFSRLCAAVPMLQVVRRMADLFATLDRMMAGAGLEKLDITEQTYTAFAVCWDSGDSFQTVLRALAAARAAMEHFQGSNAGTTLQLHVHAGLHIGPAAATVPGIRQPKYLLFGSALDVATCLQVAAPEMSVLMSPETAAVLNAKISCVPAELRPVAAMPITSESYGTINTFTIRLGAFLQPGDGAYNPPPAAGATPAPASWLHSPPPPPQVEAPELWAPGGGARAATSAAAPVPLPSGRAATAWHGGRAGAVHPVQRPAASSDLRAGGVKVMATGGQNNGHRVATGGARVVSGELTGGSNVLEEVRAVRATGRRGGGTVQQVSRSASGVASSAGGAHGLREWLTERGLLHFAPSLERMGVQPADMLAMNTEELNELGLATDSMIQRVRG